MLKSSNIETYTELLTPPDGYETEQALGLTFSMDLTMVLSCAVSLFLSKEILEDIKGERYDVISALSDAKDKLRIYGHYGRIKVPEKFSSAFTLLEPSIRSVCNSRGSFHPKLWLIKFSSKITDEKIYRLIVMSKNITDTNDWDISYHADGKIKAGNYNEALLRFIRRSITSDNKDLAFINSITKELKQVQFKNPDNISKVLFHGYPDANFSFQDKMKNPVIISPFLSEEKLIEISKCSDGNIYLLSREEALNQIKENTLENFKCYTLRDEVIDGLTLVDEYISDEIKSISKMNLHAKCYFWEVGKNTHIMIGSNNCTNSAFSINQEAAVEMVVNKSKITCKDLLESLIDNSENETSDTTVREEEISLFKPYIRNEEVTVEDSETSKEADKIRRLLESYPFSGVINKDKNTDSYNIKLTSDIPVGSIADHLMVEVALVTNMGVKKNLDNVVLFDNLEIDLLTSFVVIYIRNNDLKIDSYIVKVEYQNYSDYFSHIERKIISGVFNNTNKLINYITWLLQSDPGSSSDLPVFVETTGKTGSKSGVEFNIPLYESLLLVAATEPNKLKKIDIVIETLDFNNNIPKDELKIIKQFWAPFKKNIKR